MEVRGIVVYTVGKRETKKVLKSLENWQMTALFSSENVKNKEDMREAVEQMGICQGIINTMNTLDLFTENEYELAIEKQKDIVDTIEKSAKRMAVQ